MNILGISAFYHDSAACLIRDGKLVSAVQEERLTRKKNDASFPKHSIVYCLKSQNLVIKDIDIIAFYDKPFLKFDRLLETYLAYAPAGLISFLKSMPVWIKQKMWIKEIIRKELNFKGNFVFPEHHESHASSAFFPSPFQKAAFLTVDGVGEWATTTYGMGEDNQIEILANIQFPHSLGLLYSAFTYYTGFKVNSGEYKVMGLAPYGKPKYANLILSELVDLKEDGSFHLNMKYFNYCSGLTMTNKSFDKLFGGPPRKAESPLTQKEMDLACSIQTVTDEIMLRLAKNIKQQTKADFLCLAGGVALNCVSNGKILKSGLFKDIWIQPASGDAGGSVGAAFFAWYQYLNNERQATLKDDSMSGSYLGPAFDNKYLENFLKKTKITAQKLSTQQLCNQTADLIDQQKIIGWFQGNMEFGPRALGNRSIIGDARSPKMQSIMNLKIKFRESFRPFAPSVLEEKVSDYFDIDQPSPYMLLVAPIKQKLRLKNPSKDQNLFGIDKLNIPRSNIPAVTHIDYSARIQTVDKIKNPLYYQLIKAFYNKYTCPVIINTSFNVRGEPIVCTPEQAYLCFMRTDMDFLIMGNFLIDKNKQKQLKKDSNWKKEFELD